jgi:hypothetical protein
MYNPDRAHDPDQAARDALTELGHTPGDDPVAELHHVAADLNRQRREAQAALGNPDPDNPPPAAQILALVDLLARCATALAPLAETQLDDEEQFVIATIGLPRANPDGPR